VPLNSPFGCRFQQVYRPGEASPAFFDFEGVVLDLVGLAWAPIGNSVTNETIEGMAVLVGLSAVNGAKGPNTNAPGGIPQGENSGIREQFDCNLLEWTDNCSLFTVPPDLEPFVAEQPPRTEVVSRGTPYLISSAKLFKPGNALNQPAGQYNLYHNYPAFNSGIDTSFGKTDVKSFPYDSRFPMIVEVLVEPAVNTFPSNKNIYRYSPAIMSSALPRFRVWSQGQHPLANCVTNFFTQGCVPVGAGQIACGVKAGRADRWSSPARSSCRSSRRSPRTTTCRPSSRAPTSFRRWATRASRSRTHRQAAAVPR
jgi:hypothetical protein